MIRFDFSGKRVLVTGASRGIGFAVAQGFAEAGAELAILADDPGVVEAAGRLSASCGRPVAGHVCDITDRAAVARVVGGLGRLDVLVNNAGLELITPIREDGEGVERTFRRIVEVNVLGSYAVTREVVRTMRAGGRILFTASVWGKTAVGEFSAYCASKHAVIGLMRSLAQELGPSGITVNAVCPGWVRTEASLRSLGEMARRARRAEADVLDGILAAQAVGGLMAPGDVVSIYLFLASDAAANIAGQSYNVDRGEFMS
jgi:3-hydroxybutyrate dehydrogenase